VLYTGKIINLINLTQKITIATNQPYKIQSKLCKKIKIHHGNPNGINFLGIKFKLIKFFFLVAIGYPSPQK
jgi:hypothetical protein